ncbi:MAG: SCP2 sterol-binding domain-containing protein [Acidobacteria bacterium]|nr:SCP2 sterol-binding domain-containing protein [Acidobacteriota bacterium]
MADFLGVEWFDELNDVLRAAGPVPLETEGATLRVVLEFSNAPGSVAHALTFTLSPDGARAEIGDHLAADALIALTYADALALTNGTLDSASALREGRIKVRGDINAVVPLLAWLQQAHPHGDRASE